MLSTTQFSDLVAPVIQRAGAERFNAPSSFVDRAAKHVLKHLGISDTEITDLKSHNLRAQLLLCEVIDQQLKPFFESHPKGQGVEVCGGLSTRFHRLSEILDWPQFSWRSINHFDTDDCLQFVFSVMDNFSSAATDKPMEEWFKHVYWLDDAPKIVIIGEHTPLKSTQDIEHQIKAFMGAKQKNVNLDEIIFCHTSNRLLPHLDQYRKHLQIVAHKTIEQHRSHFSISELFKKRPRNRSLFMTHLSFSKKN